MKKILSVVLIALVLATTSGFAARLTITNNSKETIWARIDDQTIKRLSPEIQKKFKRRLAAAIGAMINPVLGPAAFVLPATARDNAPAFMEIKPGKSYVFHSGLYDIKKVTFLQVSGSFTEKVKRDDLVFSKHDYLNKKLNHFFHNYGNIYAYRQKVNNKPATIYVNMYNNVREVYFKPEVDIVLPKLETFEIKPDIKFSNLGAKINYWGWEQIDLKK